MSESIITLNFEIHFTFLLFARCHQHAISSVGSVSLSLSATLAIITVVYPHLTMSNCRLIVVQGVADSLVGGYYRIDQDATSYPQIRPNISLSFRSPTE